jgi:hypothetical protein
MLPAQYVTVLSPSRYADAKNDATSISRMHLAQMLRKPLSFAPAVPETSLTWWKLSSVPKIFPDLAEKTFYDSLCAIKPAFVCSASGSPNKAASTLYPLASPIAGYAIRFPVRCRPEIIAESNVEAAQRFVYTAEGKSIYHTALHEIIVYATISIGHHSFPNEKSFNKRNKIFGCTVLSKPPVAFALHAYGFMAYFVTVEMIGIPFLSVYSNPFFLESPEHAAACEKISEETRDVKVHSKPIQVSYNVLRSSKKHPGIFWNTKPIRIERKYYYYKFINADFLLSRKTDQYPERDDTVKLERLATFLGELELFKYGCTRAGIIFAHFHKVYDRYARICEAVEACNLPKALVPAKLWFGYCRIVLEMDWVGGESVNNGDILYFNDIARAVIWLARKGLLHIGLRAKHIRMQTDGIKLIDYFDCTIIEPFESRSAVNVAKMLENRAAETNNLLKQLAHHILSNLETFDP